MLVIQEYCAIVMVIYQEAPPRSPLFLSLSHNPTSFLFSTFYVVIWSYFLKNNKKRSTKGRKLRDTPHKYYDLC